MASPKSGQTRLMLLGALSVVCVVVLAILWSMSDPAKGRGYQLQTTNGQTFTPETLRGKPSALFFGYTHCPEVCPTTLGDLASWQAQLGPDAEKLQIFYVTVDPERDTLPLLTEYLSWADGVTGVTGTRTETDKVLRAFQIYARKVPGQDGDYSMDHTASVFLFDASGAPAGKIAYQEPDDVAVPKLRALITPGA